MKTNGTGQSIEDLREHRERLRLEASIAKAERTKKVVESISYDSIWGNIANPWERFTDWGDDWYPIGFGFGSQYDRRIGADAYVYRSEQDLMIMRARARALATINPYARGLLRNLTNYIIGKEGFKFRAALEPGVPEDVRFGNQPLIEAVQREIDRFIKANDFAKRQRGLFWRSRRDGDAFLRWTWDNAEQTTVCRYVNPEQVVVPADAVGDLNYSFGILTAGDDIEDVQAYNVRYLNYDGQNQVQEDEEIAPDEIEHIKVNIDDDLKRGISDFGPVEFDFLELARKLARNMGESGAIQAAIAWIEEFAGVQGAAADSLRKSLSTHNRTDPVTGKPVHFQRFRPGTIVYTGANKKYVAPPMATGNVTGHVEIVQTLLRAVASARSVPEYMISSDASNANYSSTLVAESPFVKYAEHEAGFYADHFRRIIEHAIKLSAAHGRLPADVLDMVDIQVETPSVQTRNKLEEAQVMQIEKQNGITSPQTWRMVVGRDSDKEDRNFEEFAEKHPDALGSPMAQTPGIGKMLGQIGQAAESRLTEAFDETKVKREHGMFSTKAVAAAKDEGKKAVGDPHKDRLEKYKQTVGKLTGTSPDEKASLERKAAKLNQFERRTGTSIEDHVANAVAASDNSEAGKKYRDLVELLVGKDRGWTADEKHFAQSYRADIKRQVREGGHRAKVEHALQMMGKGAATMGAKVKIDHDEYQGLTGGHRAGERIEASKEYPLRPPPGAKSFNERHSELAEVERNSGVSFLSRVLSSLSAIDQSDAGAKHRELLTNLASGPGTYSDNQIASFNSQIQQYRSQLLDQLVNGNIGEAQQKHALKELAEQGRGTVYPTELRDILRGKKQVPVKVEGAQVKSRAEVEAAMKANFPDYVKFKESFERDADGVIRLVESRLDWDWLNLVEEYDASIRQSSDYDCGAACMRFCARLLGCDPGSEADCIVATGSDPTQGTSAEHIEAALRALGLQCESGAMDVGAMPDCPCICHVQREGAGGHWCVVHDKTRTGKLVIHDPIDGTLVMEPSEFDAGWHDGDPTRKERFGIKAWR